MEKPPLITPKQCRAARGMLEWSRAELAVKSEVSERSLASFEGGNPKMMRANQRSIVEAFEAAGVVFIAGGVMPVHGADPQPDALAAPPAEPFPTAAEVDAIRAEARRVVAEMEPAAPHPLPPEPSDQVVMSEARRLTAELLARKAARERGQ